VSPREKLSLRAYRSKVLSRMFESVRDEVTEEWKQLHNEELHNMYLSLDIVRVIKSRRLKWAGHTAHIGEMKNEITWGT